MLMLAVAADDIAAVFIELGAAIVGLAILARLASRWGFSAIPLYLLAGLTFGNGGVLPLPFSQLLQGLKPRSLWPRGHPGSTAMTQHTRNCRDNRLVDNSPPTPKRRGCQNLKPFTGRRLTRPNRQGLVVNVPTVCSTASS
jgi:hypothetical protein